MDPAFVKTQLIDVLQTIQAISGLDCPKIVGGTKPTEDLPKFDSKIWPVAIGILAAKLGISIANDVNIFSREKTRVARTVDETVAVVFKYLQAQALATTKGAA